VKYPVYRSSTCAGVIADICRRAERFGWRDFNIIAAENVNDLGMTYKLITGSNCILATAPVSYDTWLFSQTSGLGIDALCQWEYSDLLCLL